MDMGPDLNILAVYVASQHHPLWRDPDEVPFLAATLRGGNRVFRAIGDGIQAIGRGIEQSIEFFRRSLTVNTQEYTYCTMNPSEC